LRFKFNSRKLQALYTDETGAHRYPAEVIEAFFDVVSAIDSADDERDLRALKSFHYEKLKGKRKHQHSIRLHGGFRLILERHRDEEGTHLVIIGIEDYHG